MGEHQSFVYRDSRDLTGFIDGTANPEGDEAKEAALVPGAGGDGSGSYLLTMRWVHDRRSVPYSNVREHGLYFLAFSARPDRFDRMLARMYGTAPDGVSDALMDYSKAVSAAYYFAPSLEALDAVGAGD